jgi:hypothetical protein
LNFEEPTVKKTTLACALSSLAISALFVTASGCVASSEPVDEAPADVPAPAGIRVHKMIDPNLVNESKPTGQAGTSNTLTYYGGPVIQNVNVIPVYWNSTVASALQTKMNSFYSAVTNSVYFDWLSEYNTASPAQSIGRGTRGTPFIDNNTTTSTTDAKIQAELNKLFTAGSIPAPNANNYYAIHFPKGMKITASDGSSACVQWCAYHGTYVRNGVNVYYGVLPDVSTSGCAGGCGTNSNYLNNETSVASHELIEATTDAAVGIATTYAPPLAWYNQTNGEIGDICNGQQGSVVGGDGVSYTVQKEWSNKSGACKVQ